jgi:hypothetical protein
MPEEHVSTPPAAACQQGSKDSRTQIAEMLKAPDRARADMLTNYSGRYATGDVGYHRKDRDV